MRLRTSISAALALVVLAVGGLILVHARFVGSDAGSGQQWQADGLPHVTVHYLVAGRHTSSLAFAATESGVYRRNADSTWTSVLPQTSVWSIDLLPDDRTVIAGDQQGNVNLSTDAGARWSATRVSGDAVYAVLFVGGGRRVILAGAGGGLFRSTDGGAHWTRRLAFHAGAIAALTTAPANRHVLFAGAVASGQAGPTGAYVSRDDGRTWRSFGRGLQSGGGIMSLAIVRGNDLLAGTMGRAVWRVGGVTSAWGQAAGGLPVRNDHVAGIAVLPDAPGTAYAGTLGFGVFETRDAGRHWNNVSDGLRGSSDTMIVLSLAFQPAGRVLYAGTSTGVYRYRLPVPATARPRA